MKGKKGERKEWKNNKEEIKQWDCTAEENRWMAGWMDG